jgi:hypothetical protein
VILGRVRLDGDDRKILQAGGGLVDEIVDQLNPQERERQRLLSEQEERQVASAAEVAAERRAEAEWRARQTGREPRTPLETAEVVHGQMDRLDRQQAALERQIEADGENVRPLRRPSVVAKEIAAAEAEFMAQPATVADVAHASAEAEAKAAKTKQEVGTIRYALGRLLGRS